MSKIVSLPLLESASQQKEAGCNMTAATSTSLHDICIWGKVRRYIYLRRKQ
jgi:hypothetical protein